MYLCFVLGSFPGNCILNNFLWSNGFFFMVVTSSIGYCAEINILSSGTGVGSCVEACIYSSRIDVGSCVSTSVHAYVFVPSTLIEEHAHLFLDVFRKNVLLLFLIE
jgi:hypothetical protein